MYIIDFVNYINRRYLSVPSGIATATAIIVTCESFLFYGCKAQVHPPFLNLKKKKKKKKKIRRRVRFDLLRTCVISLRGYRKPTNNTSIESLDFNLRKVASVY